jgi:prepilin-type N-terminal cleavage/methylation domain-containing protein
MQNKQGFSLIELSIVLTIIALLFTGITFGRSLITQSNLLSIITQVNEYEDATMKFKEKYGALPGDMTNAYDYWGSDCDATASNCNGDGDDIIEASASANDNEIYRFWQHLTLSNYIGGYTIKGNFTGAGIGTGDGASIGINVPKTALQNIGVGVLTAALSNYSYLSGTEYTEIKEFFFVGGTTTDEPIKRQVLISKHAHFIDSKIDDGLPGLGGVLGILGTANTCATTTSTDTAKYYLVTSPNSVCTLLMEFNR